MKRLFTFLILTIGFNSFSQTHTEMNQEAYNDFRKSDEELNEIYQRILSEYKDDTLFIENLKNSQRIWVQFRDAELKMKFPAYPDKHMGTIQPICRAFYLRELTDNRIETLKDWISGTDEYDVCDGSVKIVEDIDPEQMGKAVISSNGSIWLTANIKRDHRIFGYKKKDVHSEKMILLSVFTSEVENNPFNCRYGAYHDTAGMKDMELKYLATEDDFLKVAIVQNGRSIDEVYMLKKWFELIN